MKLKAIKNLIIFFFTVLYYSFTERTHAADFNKTLNYFLGKTNGSSMAGADLSTVQETILRVTNYVISLGGVIAFIMILYSSLMYATSFGDESKAETAKKGLIWSIVGVIIVTCYALIMRLVNKSLNMGL